MNIPVNADDTRSGFEAGMRRVFDAQYAETRKGVAPDAATRLDRIARLRDMLVKHQDAIIKAISDDFGNRCADETRLLELGLVTAAARHARKNLRRWMRPQKRHVDLTFQPARAYVRFEPLGVIGIMAPWNYPVLLALSPLVDAFAAGNRAMIKPSELTPVWSELLARIISETFDETEAAVITGEVEVAQAFSGLPFDHLIFTGSGGVGRMVMKAASANLTPVTLELGGKSPTIIAEDFDIEAAGKHVAFGKFLNSGQTCIAPDYAFVPKGKGEAFARAVISAVESSYPKLAGNPDYSSIITDRHRERLVSAIEEARAAGAQIFRHSETEVSEAGRLAPAVVLGAPDECLLMREEIFGPVLPVVEYDSLAEVYTAIAGRDRPLALYAFSKNQETLTEILNHTISGGVTLNGTLLHVAQETMAFGGVGPSGMGGYHGYDGFRQFSHARSVLKIGFINFFEKLGPPWGSRSGKAGRFLINRR